MKDIQGYEGLYAVTFCGKVWSYKNKKFLKSTEDDRGYYKVRLYKNGISEYKRIHRLVAETYLPNPNNLPQVNHKDENKSHNYLNNLEWCDYNYNINYGTRNSRVAAKLSKPVYCFNNETRYDSAKTAAAVLGLNYISVKDVANGHSNSVFGFRFCYIKK